MSPGNHAADKVPGTAALRAVLFDLDGTLYYQRRLQLLMAAELAMLPVTSCSLATTRETWRVLRVFRRVREKLRDSAPVPAPGSPSLAELQYTAAADAAGVTPARVQALVERWMHQSPLKYLPLCRRPGLGELLDFLQSRAIACGVFSDYPVESKLSALGLGARFSIKICATDPEVNAFKPHQQGFQRACALWGISPQQVLYVGDRPEVDARGAVACGMSCAIVGKQHSRDEATGENHNYLSITSFHDLHHQLAV